MRRDGNFQEEDNKEEKPQRRGKKKKKKPPMCEFCAYDDQDELEQCKYCKKLVCANPTCQVPHKKGTCK